MSEAVPMPNRAPASSKMNIILAKAEPISNGGNASVRKYFKRGKNWYATEDGREE